MAFSQATPQLSSLIEDVNAIVVAVTFALSLTLVLWHVYDVFAERNYPPGPRGFPFIGNFHKLGEKPFLTFTELAEKYGPVFRLRLGGYNAFVLNDFESINETLMRNAENFVSRPSNMMNTLTESNKYNVLYENGETWMEHRNLLVDTLTQIGVGTTDIESKLLIEIEKCVNDLRNGNLNGLASGLRNSTTGVVNLLLFGESFTHDHPIYEAVEKYVEQASQVKRTVPAVWIFPWLRFIPCVSRISEFQVADQRLEDILTEEINKSRENCGFVKSYFDKQNYQTDSKKFFPTEGLLKNAKLLYMAGGETMYQTLCWSLLYMAANPEVQRKVQQELDRVIGRERQPSIVDRSKTPYTEATLLETQRIASVTPLTPFHCNTLECPVLEYIIPEESFVIGNLWSVHHDPDLWEDPEAFRPERFLEGDGNFLELSQVIPFSMGIRNCLGKSLAKMELYLFFTSLLMNFTFENHDDQPVDLSMVYGVTIKPVNFKLKATLRMICE